MELFEALLATHRARLADELVVLGADHVVPVAGAGADHHAVLLAVGVAGLAWTHHGGILFN